MSETYLIKTPPGNQHKFEAFQDLLTQIHEVIVGSQVSFEIIANGQNVGLCFTAEAAICHTIIGQIYSIASDAEVIKIKDFTRDLKDSDSLLGAELKLAKTDLLPLKMISEFEGDSLSSLMSVLSNCAPGERVWVQYIIKPRIDSGHLQLSLSLRHQLDKLVHLFRIKYWFKKEIGLSFRSVIQKKCAQRLFKTTIRVAVIGNSHSSQIEKRLLAVVNSMNCFNTLDFNKLEVKKIFKNRSALAVFQKRILKNSFLLCTQEVAAMFHLPNEQVIPSLIHVLSRKRAPPTDLPTQKNNSDISFFGQTNFRGQSIPFGIKRSDRRRHLYCLGKSGSGKSKMLELLIQNDILAGRGVGVLDPHGDLVDNILKFIPKNRIKDVVIFDPADLQFPASFNPLEKVPEELKMRVTIGFIEIFKKLFGTNWSSRLEHVLRYTTLALLDSEGTTVLSILKMLSDKNYRQTIVANIQDNVVKNFWINEFAGWSEKFDSEAITPLLNKVGQFVSTNMIRNIVGQPENRFNFRSIMDSQKILLMKVSKGILGEENASLLGAMAVTKIYQSAMSRADIPEDQRKDFYFYVDEFQNFATDTFDEILSEARKYRLNLTIANQFIGQLSESIRKTVFGNVGTLLSFRVGGEDAKLLSAEFNPRFSERDLLNLGVREFCIKMSVEGEIKEAFSGRTSDMSFPQNSYAEECIAYSRNNYARSLAEVKQILTHWEESTSATSNEKSSIKDTTALKSSKPITFDEPIIF